jgi:hypothetical protein
MGVARKRWKRWQLLAMGLQVLARKVMLCVHVSRIPLTLELSTGRLGKDTEIKTHRWGAAA